MNQITIHLRTTELKDLDSFFAFQLDESARHMAAFTSKETTNRAAFMEKYTKLLHEPSINMQTILLGNTIVGSISKFEMEGDAEITYWVDPNNWGKGIATSALQQFLILEKMRPLFGRAAFDNTGSQKVLQNNGFIKIGEDKGFANARNAEVAEIIYRLD